MAQRLCLAGLAIAAGLSFGAATAGAQATMTEEQANREKLIAEMPPNAAKLLFGKQASAAPMAAKAIGSFARGCLAGATALPIDGEAWQVMRLSRNRNWGHPDLIALLERLAKQATRLAGWPGLLVGDISQPRGGPMLTGHASHQIGLDADVWLTPMPQRRLSKQEREEMPATNMVANTWMDVDPAVWTPRHIAVIRAAAQDGEVRRIFVNPAIKKALCREAGPDRSWLGKVRPMWGHNYHFHIRITCRPGDASCTDQDAPGSGDGCGKELDDWLALQHKAIFGPKKPGKPKKPRYWTMADLPAECQQVLVAK